MCLCVCVCVCVHAYVCASVCVSKHVCVSICGHMCACGCLSLCQCICTHVHARTHPCQFAYVWSYLRVNVDCLPLSLHRQVEHLILFVHQWRRVLPTNKTPLTIRHTLKGSTGNTVKACHLHSWHRWQLKLCSLYPLPEPLFTPTPPQHIYSYIQLCQSTQAQVTI